MKMINKKQMILRHSLLYRRLSTFLERCYTEICRETEGREVVLEDSQRLHWCQAVMAEVQRHGQVALTTVMHRTTRQVVTSHLFSCETNSRNRMHWSVRQKV